MTVGKTVVVHGCEEKPAAGPVGAEGSSSALLPADEGPGATAPVDLRLAIASPKRLPGAHLGLDAPI